MNKKHHKKHRSTKTRIELFITSSLFKVLGVILVLIGIFYLLDSTKSFDWIKTLITNLTSAAEDKPIKPGGGNLGKMLGYFLPVLLVLGAAALFAKKYFTYTFYLSLGSVIYLIAIQFVNVAKLYPDAGVALVFLVLPVVLLLLLNRVHQKPVILVLTSIYLYLFVVLFALKFGWLMGYLMPVVMLFSLAVMYSGRQMQRPVLNGANFLLAIGVFGLFWLRKFVFSSKTDFLADFFIYGSLLYILFNVITVLASASKENPLNIRLQSAIMWANLAFFGGTTAYVIIRYFNFDYLWILVAGLLLVNAAGWLLQKKYIPAVPELPYDLNLMVLAASILPLLVNQNRLLLAYAGLSVLLMFYAGYSRNRNFIFMSVAIAVVMIADYLINWGLYYAPALMGSETGPETGIILHGLIGGLVVSAVMAINHWMVKTNELSLQMKGFSRVKLRRLLEGVFLVMAFLTISWIGITGSFLATKSMAFVPISWFISGCIFFIAVIGVQSNKRSNLRTITRFSALIFGLLYIVLVYYSLILLRYQLSETGNQYLAASGLHYVALLLLIVLGIMVLPLIYGGFTKLAIVQRGIELGVILFILFLLVAEYDLLTVHLNLRSSGSQPIKDLLEFNRHLPYSILLGAGSIVALIWAALKQNPVIRWFSILLLLAVIAKIFMYDFAMISEETRTAVFILSGLLLIAFSFLYPKLRKKAHISKTNL